MNTFPQPPETPCTPTSLRVDLTIADQKVRVTFREIPAKPRSFVLAERPSIPTDGTEVEDNGGTVWAAYEVDLDRASLALASAGCFVSAASHFVRSKPAECASQLRRGIAHGLVALLQLARQHASERPGAR